MTNTLEYSLFSKIFNVIKENDKEYYCNNIIDSVLIAYMEEEDCLSSKIKEDIIYTLKNSLYTKWRNIEIFIFYNNLFNLILTEKCEGDVIFIDKNKSGLNKKEQNKEDQEFKRIFNAFFWDNSWRRKFEVLKYWKEFSNNSKKIKWFIKILEKEKLITIKPDITMGQLSSQLILW